MTEKKHETALSIPVSGSGAMQPRSVGEALELAKMIAHSDMVPKDYKGKPGNVLIAMEMGAELGLKPMPALQNIAVINGRPAVWGDALLGLVTADSRCEDVREWIDGDTAHCEVKRKGRSVVERTFSVDDAKRAGLWTKQGPWTQYPKRMLQMRARGFALRDAFPDVLKGIVSAEEAQDTVTHVIDSVPEYSEPQEGTFSAKNTPVAGDTSCLVGANLRNVDLGPPSKSPPDATGADLGAAAERHDRAPQPPAETAQTEAQQELVLPELSDGCMELLGMVSHAESHADLDLLDKQANLRRLKAHERGEVAKAIKARGIALVRELDEPTGD